jgi:hypothetical protein
MDHPFIVRESSREEYERLLRFARSTPDGDLLDLDIFRHQSTFVLSAWSPGKGARAYLPVQQPLMLENLCFAPDLSETDRAHAMTRMTEQAIVEAYRRDAGELYFLCREESTCRFAERRNFVRIDGPESELKFKVYRLNLAETFGA